MYNEVFNYNNQTFSEQNKLSQLLYKKQLLNSRHKQPHLKFAQENKDKKLSIRTTYCSQMKPKSFTEFGNIIMRCTWKGIWPLFNIPVTASANVKINAIQCINSREKIKGSHTKY